MYKTILLIIVLFSCGSDSEKDEDILVAKVEDEESDQMEDDDEDNGVFLATENWKVIKKGQHIPPGLHVRINLETGLKEAKLLDKNESGGIQVSSDQNKESSDSNERPYYGKSDRIGVINKRTKVFSTREVADMLKDINNDDGSSADPGRLPRIESSLVAPEETHTEGNTDRAKKQDKRKLPVSLHPDAEAMLKLSTVLANKSSSVSELSEALGELEYYVHRMDNAKDLNAIGGLVLVVRLLNHTHPDVRSGSAHVLGSAAQSNPAVQELSLQYGSLPLLCKLLVLSQPELVQRRALFALSALLRNNPKEQVNFMKTYHGMDILGESFSERSPQVQLKAVVLLTDFLNTELSNSEDVSGHQLELPLLLYSGILNSGWCENIPTLIHSEQLMRIEKGLLAMKVLSDTCGFSAESARLKELVKQFEKSNASDEPTEDIEYIDNLLEHCRNILKHIHAQKSEL